LGYIYNNIFQTVLFFGGSKDNSGGGIELLDKDGYTRYGTRMNYYDDYATGIAAVYVFNKINWWESQNAVNVQYFKAISNIYPLTPKKMEGLIASFQTYNIFHLNKSQTIQTGFDFDYAPPHVAEVTYSYHQATFNAFVKMLFLNRKLSLTLTGNNLFNDYSFNTKRESNGITFYSKAHYNTRSVRLSVSYSFGSNKVNVQQRDASNEDEKGRL
jgi:hypothetical protein